MKDDKVTTCLGVIFSLVLVTLVGTLLDGWALSKIWNWFVPPLFGLTSLTLWQAIGVSMVFELFTRTNTKKSNSDDEKHDSIGEAIIYAAVKVTLPPVLSVGIAWVVLQFAF